MVIPRTSSLTRVGKPCIALAVLLCSGCLPTIKEQTREYQPPESALTTTVVPLPDQTNTFAINESTIQGDQLVLTLSKQVHEQPYSYQEVMHQTRTVRTPAYLPLLLPIPGWFVCMAPHTYCFGSKGEWTTQEIEQRNKQPSGPVAERWIPWVNDKPDALLIGQDQAGADEGRVRVKLAASKYQQAQYRVPIKQAMERLGQRAYQTRVALSYSKNTGQPTHTETVAISPAQVASLQLHNDAWLPLAEQREIYHAGLESALAANRHGNAIYYYRKLDSLPLDLPEGFYYQYAYSLRQVGRTADAKVFARRYIDEAGKEGEFYIQALKLL